MIWGPPCGLRERKGVGGSNTPSHRCSQMGEYGVGGHKEDRRWQVPMVGRAKSPGSMEQGEGRELGGALLRGWRPNSSVPSFQDTLRLKPRHPSC